MVFDVGICAQGKSERGGGPITRVSVCVWGEVVAAVTLPHARC